MLLDIGPSLRYSSCCTSPPHSLLNSSAPSSTCCSLTSTLRLRRVEPSHSGIYTCSPAGLHDGVRRRYSDL